MAKDAGWTHEGAAEESAERAGGYLQAAELSIEAAVKDGREHGDPDVAMAGASVAQAYAQMATASATLSLAQRVAANGS
jgi:hypothetical protein